MKKTFSIIALCVTMFCFVLTGCIKDKMCAVTFDSNGGSYVAPIKNVTEYTTINKPNDPTKDGYSFEGWYYTNTEPPFQDGTFALWQIFWNFEKDVVTANMVLHAKWTEGAEDF